MKLKIERPRFKSLIAFKPEKTIADIFNEWFDENVQPINDLLEKSVQVYSCKACEYEPMDVWKTSPEDHVDEDGTKWCTDYKGLLINVQPIKKDTVEDVLRDMISRYDGTLATKHLVPVQSADLIKRAKALLDEERLNE